MSVELVNSINELKVAIATLAGEVNVGENKLESKLDRVLFLEYMADFRKDEITPISNRINKLYIKVAVASGGAVGLLELILAAF